MLLPVTFTSCFAVDVCKLALVTRGHEKRYPGMASAKVIQDMDPLRGDSRDPDLSVR
jgi:hypothetical protein